MQSIEEVSSLIDRILIHRSCFNKVMMIRNSFVEISEGAKLRLNFSTLTRERNIKKKTM